MEYDITAKHFDLPEVARARIQKALGRLDKYSDRIITAHLILERDGSRHEAELQLKTRSSYFSAKETSYDLHLAVDEVVKKVERQLTKWVERMRDRKSRVKRGEG